MPIQTQWLLEPSVLFQSFVGKLNLNEIEDANQNLSQFTFRNRQGKFHLIADLSQLAAMPEELATVAENLHLALSRSHITWFVTYGGHDVAINFAAALIPQFTRIQHKHFHNREEAFDFLTMMDASLPILA